MAGLVWSDNCSVGIDSIDGEHRVLFDTIAELESAATQNLDRETVAALLTKLANATREHFSQEEELMKTRSYPGLALHAANHQRLIEKLNAFAARYGPGSQAMDQHAANFLRDWLLHHVQNDDRRLGAWLRDRKPA